MSFEALLNQSIAEIPKAVSAGVVDTSTGLLLALEAIDSPSQAALELVAASRKLFGEASGRAWLADGRERHFKEILVMSTNLLHIFTRLERYEATVMVVICRADANIGLALRKARLAVASTVTQ